MRGKWGGREEGGGKGSEASPGSPQTWMPHFPGFDLPLLLARLVLGRTPAAFNYTVAL